MNKLVFFFQKTCKLFGPKKLRGYFRARNSLKNESVLYSAANCSCEFPHNNLNPKVTQEHSVIVIIIFCELQTTRIKYFSYSCTVLLGFYNVSVSCHLTVKACQIISDYWLFVWMNWKRRLSTTAKYNSLLSKWVIVLGLINNTKCH